MKQKSISGKNLDKTITSEDILGKEVFDVDGTNIGVVEKVLIHPKNLEFVGISIDKGFLRKGLTIGKKYLWRITPHAVILNIRVAFEIKGKMVFDNEGRRVGKVKSIELEGGKNILASISVKPGMIGAEINIPARDIKEVGEGVMLKTKKESYYEVKK